MSGRSRRWPLMRSFTVVVFFMGVYGNDTKIMRNQAACFTHHFSHFGMILYSKRFCLSVSIVFFSGPDKLTSSLTLVVSSIALPRQPHKSHKSGWNRFLVPQEHTGHCHHMKSALKSINVLQNEKKLYTCVS